MSFCHESVYVTVLCAYWLGAHACEPGVLGSGHAQCTCWWAPTSSSTQPPCTCRRPGLAPTYVFYPPPLLPALPRLDAGTCILLVELDFRAHFELPRSSHSYAAFLGSLPVLLVIEADRMLPLVEAVARRMALEFKDMVRGWETRNPATSIMDESKGGHAGAQAEASH